MNESKKITNDLQRRVNQLIKETLKDIRTEALDEFDRNFEREAFFNEKWTRRKFNDDKSRGLLVQTGNLRRSITGRITSRDSVVIETTEPYARIHNEGGTITVTRKRGLLVQTGNLRRSITGRITSRDSVVIETTEPYARIHNEGGTITVTRKMKAYFWYRYQTVTGGKAADGFSNNLQRKKNGAPRNNKRNRALTAEAEFYRAMALKKAGSKITIPKRQFIGNHPDLEKLLKEIFYNNAKNFDVL